MERGAVTKHDLKKSPRTGDWRYMKPEVNKKKCIGCGTCVKFCPEAVIELVSPGKKIKSADADEKKKIAEIDYEFCKGCGVCANVCPTKAIIMNKI